MKLRIALAALWMAFFTTALCADVPAPPHHSTICTVFPARMCQFDT